MVVTDRFVAAYFKRMRHRPSVHYNACGRVISDLKLAGWANAHYEKVHE